MSVLHSHPFDLSTFVSTDVKDRDQYTCWNNLSQLRTLAPFLGCIYLKIEAPYLASMLQDFCAPVHEFLSRCSSSQIVLRIEQISAYLSDINTTISISDVSLFLSIYLSWSELAANLQVPMIVLQPIISLIIHPLSGLNLLEFSNQCWNLIELLFFEDA